MHKLGRSTGVHHSLCSWRVEQGSEPQMRLVKTAEARSHSAGRRTRGRMMQEALKIVLSVEIKIPGK